jgi:lipopolysaccharide transport system ATP-binding protein
MPDVVIKAEGLGKKYLIGHQSERERYTALRDVMARNVKGLWNKTRQVLSGQQLMAGDEIEEFWALRDIDFEIKRGDRVGIIGRNGAGKSTLLKVLSRITEPSEGKVTIKGRVASLLEVGTGFHPELTGRENIFLNGAILGMTRIEIKKKFDEIVDFAGVEKFLDTPVKRYSSGMYVRLAFAVAAHLEPEILVVDEVLAVGDAEFQKKCLGKMEDVSKNEGRTVLFVSHNILAIESLTINSILLNKGVMSCFGTTKNVVDEYLKKNIITENNVNDFVFQGNPKVGKIKKIIARTENSVGLSRPGETIEIVIGVQFEIQTPFNISFVVENEMEQALFCTQLNDFTITMPQIGYKEYKFYLESPNLRSGHYLCSVALFLPDQSEFFDLIHHFPFLEIDGLSNSFPSDNRWGDLYFPIKWHLINESN